MFANRVLALLAAVWFGAYLLAGYGVAPLLFQSLPKEQAGNLAGALFSAVNYIGLFVWAILYLAGLSAQQRSYGQRSKLSSRIVALTWLLLAVSQFALVPLIRASSAIRSGSWSSASRRATAASGNRTSSPSRWAEAAMTESITS